MLLRDSVRTTAYKRAIEKHIKKTDVALDLGCGSGILSLLAAKQGCRKVYAVDRSSVIDDARHAAQHNGLDTRIEFIKGDIHQLKLKEPIDILIQEQIGCFLWDEGVINNMARVKPYLKPDARVIPSKAELYLAPCDYVSDYEHMVAYWSRKRYGLDFSPYVTRHYLQLIKQFVAPSIIRLRDTKTFLHKAKLAYTVDFRKDTAIPQQITAAFNLKSGSHVRGVCGFFKVFLDDDIFFSTAPRASYNHWGQIFIPCVEPKKINKRSALHFTLFPKQESDDWTSHFEFI
jgi:2-polyprenyl-3-methyl-5-hydroxy-6-metoxy-1,4-benzoquinol methylase